MRWILQIAFTVLTCVSSAATYYVSPNGSDLSDGLSQAHPFLSIGHAVAVASSGSSIRLFPGKYSGSQNVDVTIKQNLSITSLGTSDNTIWELLGGPGSHRAILLPEGAQLSLAGITFQDGVQSNYGGAIWAVGGNTLNISGCAFKNNQVLKGTSSLWRRDFLFKLRTKPLGLHL